MKIPDVSDIAPGPTIESRRVAPTTEFEPFPLEEIEQSVPARFERQAQRYPDRLAVKSRAHCFTYAELNERANSVAHAILSQCGDVEEPVALLLDQGAPLIAAIMGVLKAGKTYVPLDPQFPRARLAYMNSDAQAGLIITSSCHLAAAHELSPRKVAVIDIDALDPELSRTNPQVAIDPNRGTNILYTSGSTGQPKGVLQNHRNLLFEVLRVTNSFHVCQEDRVALLQSCSSSHSLRRIFPALLNGASLHLLDIKAVGLADLPQWYMREGITIGDGRRLLRDCAHSLTGEDQFPRLRLVTFGGEPVYRRDVELYKEYLSPRCLMLINLATTETGSDRHYFIDKQTEIPETLPPVGYATEGTEILLLDQDGREVGPGEVGEIAVKSRYLSLGYWRKPELTRERFRPTDENDGTRIYLTGDLGRMSPDGCLFHLGRKDFQVKIRGYRIETAEVETALLNLGAFTEVVVLAQEAAESRIGIQGVGSVGRDAGDVEKRLVAYLLTTRKSAPTVSALRAALAETLPEYMIPSSFVMLEKFPRTPTGKVDRKALPPPRRVRPALDRPFIAPRNPLEEVLAAMWAQRLNLDEVGIDDPFLELGGDSLLATGILSRVRRAFRLDLPQRVLFESPTIAGVSEALVEREPKPGWMNRAAREWQRIEHMTAEEVSTELAHLKRRASGPRPAEQGSAKTTAESGCGGAPSRPISGTSSWRSTPSTSCKAPSSRPASAG